MGSGTKGFAGTSGRLAGAVMARLNRDMEQVAAAELAPGPSDRVLAVGFGPGVGVAALVPMVPHGLVAGIDPSGTMLGQARRRNRAAIDTGRVQLAAATSAAIPWPDAAFDGAVAVNSVQLWDPFDQSVREAARVLAPGGRLVTVTHCWALEKRMPVPDWVEATTSVLAESGFEAVTQRTAPFRSGEGLVLRAVRSG